MTKHCASTPPMGWNSFDCYDMAVTEEDVLGNAEWMARHLKRYGWEYVVIDGMWYDPTSAAWGRSNVPFTLDEHGRPLPCLSKFPSAAHGRGFKPIADRVHDLGLKFGIHIMRGTTFQAVRSGATILGADRRVADIADLSSRCSWWEGSVGINPRLDGAQAWYDSLFAQYVEWGVDFVKADDISAPYNRGEIDLIRHAIDRCGREIVLSLSPGETPVAEAEHVTSHAQMWRISGDFWDEWPQLVKMFDLLEKWNPHRGAGHWPDADMLPLGVISIRRNPPLDARITRFTKNEQRLLMTLWTIARSPLMFGGDMRVLDAWTLSLITNEDVLAMHRESTGNHPLRRDGNRIAWTARSPDGGVYLALFNVAEVESFVSVPLADLGLKGPVKVRDLWELKDLAPATDRATALVPPHCAVLMRLTDK